MMQFLKYLWCFLLKLLWPATRERAPPLHQSPDRWNLDTPLFHWSPFDSFTLRDACTHIHAMGGSGSGKTSALFATLLRAWMAYGGGALILCPKKETRSLCEKYAQECGRSKHLIVISPDHPEHTFNFMEYALKRQGKGGFAVENLVSIFSYIVEIAQGGKADMRGGDDQFWSNAMREFLRAAVGLLLLAKGTMTIDDLYRLITEAAQSPDEASSKEWQEQSFVAQCIREADQKEMTPEQAHDFQVVCTYWLRQYPCLAEKTRSGITATVSGTLSTLMMGYGHTLFSTTTTITPEVCFQGGLIVLDIPPETYGNTGRIFQCLFKYFWQLSVLQRDEETLRPVMLMGDESQYWITSQDFSFLAVARSSRVAVCYLTQNISNYYATLGANSRDSANALLGNFGTHLFFANVDHLSNKWASDLVSVAQAISFSFSSGANTSGSSHNTGGSEAIKSKLLPSAFTTLRRGGPMNNLQVDAIVVKAGGTFRATGDIFIKTTFHQR